MILLAFLMLTVGGILLGGSWSFFRQKKPWWVVALMAVLGVACVLVALWRIQQGV